MTIPMDITRKLELIANLKPGDMWPAELGPELGTTNNWGTALSSICAEALAEIQRLRVMGNPFSVPGGIPPSYFGGHGETLSPANARLLRAMKESAERYIAAKTTIYAGPPVEELVNSAKAKICGATADQVIIDDPHKPESKPDWGSSFAMNTENWA